MLPLAEVESFPSWALIIGLSQLASLGLSTLQLVRMSTGKSSERQIEPTTLASLSAKIDGQTTALSTMNREVGQLSESVGNVTRAVEELRRALRDDISGAHRRIDEISEEVARHAAEIEALQRSCSSCQKR